MVDSNDWWLIRFNNNANWSSRIKQLWPLCSRTLFTINNNLQIFREMSPNYKWDWSMLNNWWTLIDLIFSATRADHPGSAVYTTQSTTTTATARAADPTTEATTTTADQTVPAAGGATACLHPARQSSAAVSCSSSAVLSCHQQEQVRWSSII